MIGASRQAAGARAESLARRHLGAAGLAEVARNWRCRAGELDLVMRDAATLVFVEVRYRRSDAFGGARASVDARKQARLIRVAEHFLAAHRDLAELPCRFDVVAISGPEEACSLEWIRDAFGA